jgi:kynureninase
MRHRHAGTGCVTGRAAAEALDAADALAPFAAEFHHPTDANGRRLAYLCGHSLGLQPIAAAADVEQELADWRRLAVNGHWSAGRPWSSYHARFSAPLAALVGAAPTEVVAMNSLTVNLHLLMVSFFRPSATRNCILIERSAFPSDRYAVVSQLRFHGLDPDVHLLEIGPRDGESRLRTGDLVEAIERHRERLALVLLPGVQYLSGQALDLDELIRAARRCGAATGLDLAHSIGNVPARLHDWGADFAVWCSYKYLNGGPGAVGGCFVHERHAHAPDLPRFAGWWGHDAETRFLMGPEFVPMRGAAGWQLSNPPILALAPLLASLGLFERAGLDRLRDKSIGLTGFLQAAIEARLHGRAEIITPTEAEARGCQLSIRLHRPADQARRCHESLAAAGVVGDWREPDILRLAPAPLYNSYLDVHRAVDALESVA